MKNVDDVVKQVLARKGKGPWMVWFPKDTHKYISRPIKTKSDLQALGSWLAAETDDRSWFNTVFRDYDSVVYRGRKYTKDEGKVLYKLLVKNDDWESVDIGNPTSFEKSKTYTKKAFNKENIPDLFSQLIKVLRQKNNGQIDSEIDQIREISSEIFSKLK